MPAVRPASGLRPITLNEKPSRLLRMSQGRRAATARAKINDTFARSPPPNR